jgi:Tfp pilus assembly protein PilN
MFGLAGRLKKLVYMTWQDIIGVKIRDDGSVCLLELREDDDWQVKARMLLPPENGHDLLWQAKRIAGRLEEEGLWDVPLVLFAKTEKDGFWNVPPEENEIERKELAYWALEGELGNVGVDIEDCAVAVYAWPQETRPWGGAVSQEYLISVQEAFEQAGIRLLDILAVPEDETDYTYCVGMKCWQNNWGKKWGGGLLNQEQHVNRWKWPAVAAIVAGVVLFLSGIVIGWDFWMLYVARQENWSAKQELTRLTSEQNKMKMFEHIRQETAGEEKHLQELSVKNIPWYSVLVHFGSRTVEGVWLERLEFEGRDKLHVAGRAVSYEAVADFVKTFEEDRDFFPQGAVLESSEEAEKENPQSEERISFQLSINL